MTRFVTFQNPASGGTLALHDWVIALVFAVLALGLFTRHHDFPSFYHPDEPSKARQLIEGEYNFNHPLLLLQTTKIVLAIQQVPMTQQAVTEAGRIASAILAAVAVGCVVLIAVAVGGTWAGLVAGALALTNHQLYELAHYMKEDPALACGIAVFFLAAIRAWQSRKLGYFILLGVGAALAISGKYIGALVLPVAALVLWRSGGWRGTVAFLAAFLVVALVINFPMLSSFSSLTGNVSREMDYAVHGHKGLGRSVPHGVYGAVFRESTNPLIWILVGLYYLSFILRWKRVAPWERTLAIFPVVYVLILSFSPKTHHRYFLPDTILICVLAGLAVFSVTLGSSLWTRVLRVVLPLAAITWSVVQVVAKDASFQNDSRRALVTFVQENIPADAVIVQDKRVNLPSRENERHADSPYFLQQTLLGKLFAADVGTIEELRARGIRYVAVSEGDYGRFFLKTHQPGESGKDEYERRKRFYEVLFTEGKILWECPAGPQQYLQPAIKFYYLPETSPAP